MWTDNETTQDFLNFEGVAKTVAEIIKQADSRPISIGVSGAWGVGKSSMIKLIQTELSKPNTQNQKNPFIFIEFNAWLYQGYDDARAALIDVVASKLIQEAEFRKTGVEKSKDLLKRVNWLRLAKLTAGTAVSVVAGGAPIGLLKTLLDAGSGLLDGEITDDDITKTESALIQTGTASKELLKGKELKSPPKEIEALRKSFEELLEEMNVTLVVLIDDLDRCLPETTISTLEAIRLLLFLKNTAFVIAADDQMIKHAVKRHFQGVDDKLVINYFDKLIQVPIRVPPLGTQEVRAYMMLLFIENSSLKTDEKERIRNEVCLQLGRTWQGKRVDLKFIRSLNNKLPDELIARLDTADRLAPVMTSATGIAGNPRLIKRFLNALSIRMSMARAQGVSVDESALAKVLLFERCGDTNAYAALIKAVSESDTGKPAFLLEWEQKAVSDQESPRPDPWKANFISEWLRLPPQLGDMDLRGILYVSREHTPLITAEDRLSPEAAELLEALLEHPSMARSSKDQLTRLTRLEISVMMDRLLVRAQQEQEWGTPDILEACMTLISVDSSQGQRLAGFLLDRPSIQIKPEIIPKISGESWAKSVLEAWVEEADISSPVKKAIKSRRKT